MIYRSLLGMIVLHMCAAWSMAYEEVENLVDIVATDRAFIAIVDGRRKFSEPFCKGEVIQWQGAEGKVGAFLTNQRLLTVSVTSGKGNTQLFNVNEKKASPQALKD